MKLCAFSTVSAKSKGVSALARMGPKIWRDNGKNMEATIMENQMEKKMENEMETGVIWG